MTLWEQDGILIEADGILCEAEECPCGVATEDGCDHCCDADTLPQTLKVTVPSGWTDGTECDQCNEMAGEWDVPLDSFLSPGANCSFFGAACASWKLTQTNWCEMDCDNGLGAVFYRFEIEVQLWCNRPTTGECQLEAFVGVGRGAADDDPCPRQAKQKYVLARSSVPEDCRYSGLTLNASGGLIGDSSVCSNPPSTISVTA